MELKVLRGLVRCRPFLFTTPSAPGSPLVPYAKLLQRRQVKGD